MIKCEYCKLVGPGNWECENPDAHLKAQAEVSSADGDFDRVAADSASSAEKIYEPKYGGKDHSGYDTLMKYEVNSDRQDAFINGAHWQFNKDSAALSAMKSELDKWKSEYENLFNRKFEGPYDEIEKLRAEKANEWKKMDEAKDAFAVHTTELENELDKLRAENAILREGLEFYADVDNWENPCVINDPDLKAQKALTAADKVRSGG